MKEKKKEDESNSMPYLQRGGGDIKGRFLGCIAPFLPLGLLRVFLFPGFTSGQTHCGGNKCVGIIRKGDNTNTPPKINVISSE